MKILATSDWHVDATTAGFSRFDDVVRSVERTVEAAIEEKVGLYLFTGDLCDPDLGKAHTAAALTIASASRLLDHGIRSMWVVGNHDVVEDGTGTSTLEPLAAYASAVGNHWVRVFARPTVIEAADFPFAIVPLPYVARSHAYGPEEWIAKAGHFLRDMQFTGRVLVPGHLMLEGISPGSETTDMARGRDLFYPIEKVLATWGDRAIMVNGHYHERQMHRGVQVVGSLERITFGEEHASPGFLLMEVQ